RGSRWDRDEDKPAHQPTDGTLPKAPIMAAIMDASVRSTDSVTPFGSVTLALSPDTAPSPAAIIDRSRRSVGGSPKPLGLRSPSAMRSARASATGINIDT